MSNATNGFGPESNTVANSGDNGNMSTLRLRTGQVLSWLVTAFFLLDAAGKLVGAEPAIKATVELGWPASSVFHLGLLLLVGAVLYLVPRTTVLGAIYLTGYLGGAIASQYRVGSPLFSHVLFGAYVAAIMWTAIFLRFPSALALVTATTGKR